MDKQKRKELMEQYKQMKTHMGIIRITNNVNGKIYLATCSNLKNRWMSIRMQLDIGRFPNSKLQEDWNQLGEDVFEYEVIEKKEVTEDMDTRWELKQMEKVWLEKLQPFGDKGYNIQK